jgi:hypothetical protein
MRRFQFRNPYVILLQEEEAEVAAVLKAKQEVWAEPARIKPLQPAVAQVVLVVRAAFALLQVVAEVVGAELIFLLVQMWLPTILNSQ